jgi:hypothetical protein
MLHWIKGMKHGPSYLVNTHKKGKKRPNFTLLGIFGVLIVIGLLLLFPRKMAYAPTHPMPILSH